MPRNNFFSNVPESTTSASKEKKLTSPANHSRRERNDPTHVARPKRITYSIKIDPEIRKSIKSWAITHDVTISSVIEALARTFLKDLTVDDIKD